MEKVNNPMQMTDLEILKWLDEKSLENDSLKYSWIILKQYYNKCVEELNNISIEESPFESDSDFKSQYNLCKTILSNKLFADECIKYFGEKNVLEAFNILKNFDNNNVIRNNKQEWIIEKIIRLYNMYLKLGHSARITYIAMYESDCVLNGNLDINNGNNIQLFKNTITLSALLHDIGRFYQAAHYNNLLDSEMKNKENLIDNLKVDHAIAGYYYAISSSFELHKILGDEKTDFEKAKLCMEAIAATVVKLHQKPNSEIPHLESSIDSNILNSEELLDSIYDFINYSYTMAESKKYYVSTQINEKHKKFIDEFISSIKSIVKKDDLSLDFDVASGFLEQEDKEKNVEDFEELSNKLLDKLKNLNVDNIEQTTDYMIDTFKNKVDDVPEEEIIKFRKKIYNTLEGMLNYDISKSIDDIFINEQESSYKISDCMKYMLSTSLSMTMDADKIDIFNQRALGIYNVPYNPTKFQIFPTDNESLIELLNKYFKFKLSNNPIIINSDVISVLNGFSNYISEGIKEYLSDFNEYLYDDKNIRKDIEIYAYENRFIINIAGKQINIESDKIYKMFTTTLYKFISSNFKRSLFEYDKKENKVTEDTFVDPELLDFKQFKTKYVDVARISVEKEVLEKNVYNLSDEEKIIIYRKILVSDGLDERFLKEGNNPSGNRWILKIGDSQSQHIVSSNVVALIWQLNQFLFTNMRCVYSYQFIKDNNILENIQKQYEQKSPIVAEVLRPYIDYAKYFVDSIINMREENKIGDVLTGKIVDEKRKEIYDKFILNLQNNNLNSNEVRYIR